MRVVSVVGARSELVKCAPVSRVLRERHEELLVHTGHRFAYGTSPEFFADLGLALPDHDLGIDEGTHAEDTGRMLQRLGQLVADARPDFVLVYGSSNGTLAAALAASKLGVPIGHMEAGLRSYHRSTPSEINRIVVDHVARLHFCPTHHAVDALAKEGIVDGVFEVGDTLLDSVVLNFERAKAEVSEVSLASAVGLDTLAEPFAFATVHHHENTDDAARLESLLVAFSRLPMPVILPLHPRTQASLQERPEVASRIGPNVAIVDPLRPLHALLLVSRAQVVLTDSGGLQREAFFLGVPCVTLRDDTEFVDTLVLRANTICGADVETIVEAVDAAVSLGRRGTVGLDGPFGDGNAAEKIVGVLERELVRARERS
ncbi:UDP-N-acetylglucosamine 2-epimerase (non-hydrolyzing) [Myxococcota bacterium]|nr:UDP-N-acetylglucosamine 2-epimerase (non-hydrolyzing) [Myxococcota bacterium]